MLNVVLEESCVTVKKIKLPTWCSQMTVIVLMCGVNCIVVSVKLKDKLFPVWL